MVAQFDLFGAGPTPPQRAMAVQPQPARPAQEAFFPAPPTPAWGRVLAEAGQAGRDVTFFVSPHWTGIVKESLQAGMEGRTLLYRDGSMHPVNAASSMHGRVVYMDRAAALALHATHPLVAIETRTLADAVLYRMARRGEAPATLDPPRKRGDG